MLYIRHVCMSVYIYIYTYTEIERAASPTSVVEYKRLRFSSGAQKCSLASVSVAEVQVQLLASAYTKAQTRASRCVLATL